MMSMMKQIKGILRRDDGVTMMEYAIMAALVAIIAIPVLRILGPALAAMFQKIADSIKV
jgi:pilus assembly protein Flp/PilA